MEVSATWAARNFAELLDAVEHKGARIRIARRGRVIAQIEPVAKGRGAVVKSLLKRHPNDAHWMESIRDVRELMISEDRF
jgi:prevent-host-death family protein